jgi:hypothetical protein
MKLIYLLLVAILITGCASLASHEHAHALKLALQDDQTCQSHGWRYPQPRYVTCRMLIDDKRQYRDWMNLQLMQQTQYQNPTAPPAYPYKEVYRPLDRDHYDCRYVIENGKDYILCGEQTQS